MMVGVWLWNLVPDDLHTMSLFADDDKQLRLSRAIDEINDRFGKSVICLANVQGVLHSAPTRIPFKSVPNLADF